MYTQIRTLVMLIVVGICSMIVLYLLLQTAERMKRKEKIENQVRHEIERKNQTEAKALALQQQRDQLIRDYRERYQDLSSKQQEFDKCESDLRILYEHFTPETYKMWSDGTLTKFAAEARYTREDHSYYYPTPAVKKPNDIEAYHALPRLAIVVAIDPHSLLFYKTEISAWACYCALHGYHFIEEHIHLLKGRHFFHNRQRVIQKYLPHYQWVVFIDGDSWVVNRTKRFEEILDDRYDLLLSMRENHEIFCGAIIIRNSPYGRSFLDNWLKWSDNGQARMNFDNGDLIYHVIHEMKPPGWEKCKDIYHNGTQKDLYAHFYMCAYDAYYKTGVYKTWQHIRLSPVLSNTSWFRTFEEWEHPFHKRAFPEVDFVLHGKTLHKYIPEEDVYCIEESNEPNSIRKTLYLTREEAIKSVTLHNFIDYPLCWQNDKNICTSGCDRYDFGPLELGGGAYKIC